MLGPELPTGRPRPVRLDVSDIITPAGAQACMVLPKLRYLTHRPAVMIEKSTVATRKPRGRGGAAENRTIAMLRPLYEHRLRRFSA